MVTSWPTVKDRMRSLVLNALKFRSGTYMQPSPIGRGVRGLAGYSGINYWSGADWTSLRRVQQLCILHCYFGIISLLSVWCWQHVSPTRSIARSRGRTIKLYLTRIYNAFCPCRQIAVLDCWDLMVINDGNLYLPVSWAIFLIRKYIQFINSVIFIFTFIFIFIFIILTLFKSWLVTGVVQLFFPQLQSEKKACIWAFHPRALCEAVRACAAPLMCFLNYPYWIHYVFALLNLLHLAALQWRVKKRKKNDLGATGSCGRTSKFPSAPSKVIKRT